MRSIDLVHRGGFAAALLAACFVPASDGRAQTACMPTQTVSESADANGVYTTTLTCANTAAAAGAADYRHLHYNHRQGPGQDAADRDTTIPNNEPGNHLALTIGNGVIFTAGGYVDVRFIPTDAAILLRHAGGKTLTVEDGAVINLERTPRGYSSSDPARPPMATPEYDPIWYSGLTSVVDELAGLAVYSRTSDGSTADISITHNGVINIDIEMMGTYAEGDWNYGVNGGSAIDALVSEDRIFGSPFDRTDIDIDIKVGATGVIRHVEGTDGLNAIRAENTSADGNIEIDLAAGSQIDVSEGGGYGVYALIERDGRVRGDRLGHIIVNAHGTIRAAMGTEAWDTRHGTGIYAESRADSGRIRITSSGTIETVQGAAIDARATIAANAQRDDPDTPEIEGHIVDVTGGTIETRGTTAIYASISNYDSAPYRPTPPDTNADDTARANSHMTVRVAEGTVVRARALTQQDYANGAITQETLGATASGYLVRDDGRWYGWRKVDVTRETDSGETETVKRLEPIITAIAVRDLSRTVADDAPRDRVLIDGTVETVGGKADVDPAVWLEGGGLVVVGANGRVRADSGLAISGGCSSDYRNADRNPVDLTVTPFTWPTVDCDTVDARTLEVRVAGTVEGDIRVLDDGVLDLVSMEGSTIAGTVHDPAGPLTVAGSIGRVLYSAGGTVTVESTGSLTGVEVDGKTESLGSESGDLSLTVAGTVTGDLEAPEGGKLTLNVQEGGTVTGTAHDPVGPLTVAGSIGRVLYSAGGAVTVTRTGRLAGVEVDGKTEALGSESGALSLTVNDKGKVTGDVRARGAGGRLTLDVKQGGTLAGTVHDPVGPRTVVGSIGRVLYSAGGTVTVTSTGRLTGVAVGGRIEALGSESGALSLTVNDKGMVTGDVEARGADGRLTLDVKEGGTLAGTVRDPVGPLTVAGSIGRLLYSSGGAVTVASTGRLTGVDGVALRSDAGDVDLTVAAMGMAMGDIDARGDGDLKVSVSGTVDGDIFGRGAGEHEVTVARGGAVTGTVDLGASEVTADGSVGRVLLRRGGMAAVGATGRLTGVDGMALRSDGGDLGATVAGVAMGDIDARGDGDLTVMVAGTVDGDIFGRDAGVHTVTIARGGRVTGTIDLGGDGMVRVDGMAGRVRFESNGAVTVGPAGRIVPDGDDEAAVASRSGAPMVTIVVRDGETQRDARKRVDGAIRDADGREASLTYRDEDGALLPDPDTVRLGPDGAYDIVLERTATGALHPVRRLAARTRVYEALPSVLLGMERPASHAVRAEAPRASNGAWARVDASRGSWEAASSANAGTGYDHRGFSFQAGVDAVLGEETQAGVSVHGRRATVDVSRNGGKVEARGVGAGLSATWSSGAVFVDGQAAVTLYDLDLTSTLRGALKKDVAARGLSAALEAGRAVPVADGITVTPRARVAYSSLSLSEFDDSVGARVSLDRGRSLTGRAGALAERVFGEGRVFGSLDVEHEFEAETRMSVGGTSLETSGEETRWLAGVGAEHDWEDGRFTLRGALGYAGSGGGTHDYGGRASLSMRF